MARPDRATMADMVALLRASGGFSLEDVAGALGLSTKTIDQLALTGEGRLRHWTPESVVREVLRFYDRRGVYPNSSNFRSWNDRKLGLPSWGGLTVIMCGYNPQNIGPWAWRQDERWARQRTLERAIQLGVIIPTGTLPRNGWVMTQFYMASYTKQLQLKPEHVLHLPNVTARRAAMTNYGEERLCREAGELIASDRFGTLWRFDGPTGVKGPMGEDTMMLEVENKTPEPDGSFAKYFLRVPPDMTVPQQAVAWTFGVIDAWERFDMSIET